MSKQAYYSIGRLIMWIAGGWALVNLLIFLLSGFLSGGFFNLIAAVVLTAQFLWMRKATNDYREKEMQDERK